MIRPGELACLSEDQRAAMMDMIKTGKISMDDAFDEVKRTKPKTFDGLKYLGSYASASVLVHDEIPLAMAHTIIAEATEHIKKIKIEEIKVRLIISTINIRIIDAKTEDTAIENDSLLASVFFGAVPGDKKKFAFITNFSRLGLFITHFFNLGKFEIAEITEVFQSRRRLAKETKSVVHTVLTTTDDTEEEEESSHPTGMFRGIYFGTASIADGTPQAELPQMTLNAIQTRIGSEKKFDEIATKWLSLKKFPDNVTPAYLVISSEGIRVVDQASRDVIRTVVIKAITQAGAMEGKKTYDMYIFCEVDERRNVQLGHLFLCDKGKPLLAQAAMVKGVAESEAEAKKRAGNPFRAMGANDKKITGPLMMAHVSRKDLTAIKIIGAGQFGKVYLAMQSIQGVESQRAVKMLRGGASDNDRNEFLREAETMIELGMHANIVSLTGVVVTQRPWLVVLEFCIYGDLGDVLVSCRRKKIDITLQEKLCFTEQIANGMLYIASKGFVHMDLAARNVLLHENNLVKVADFGLTHHFDPGTDSYKQSGVMKLSIRWLALDAFDTKYFSEKTDVWSFGITIWEIFAKGEQPYKGIELTDVLKLVRKGLRLEKQANTPQKLFDLLLACWQKESIRRPSFASIAETVRFIIIENPGEPLRDVASLLNNTLAASTKALSLKRKKDAAQEAPK